MVAVSQALRDGILEIAGPIPVDVVPNGVDLERFCPIRKEEARERCGISSIGFIFMYVGRLIPGKGLEPLLEAFWSLGSLREAKLYLVGNGGFRRNLEERAQGLGIGNRIVFAGARLHDEIPLWLNAADCLILPSFSEGCPNVVLEASACGCPIIATRIGGIPEIIKHGENGILVEPGDPAGLARAMSAMMLDPAASASLAARAFVRVQTIYTWASNVEKMNGIYSAVVRQWPRRSMQSQL
jgi:glycosyltransferase involved in cell wall biosynthesis